MQPGRAAIPPRSFPAQTHPSVIPDADRQSANFPKILRISAGFGAPIAKFFGSQETEWSAKNIGTGHGQMNSGHTVHFLFTAVCAAGIDGVCPRDAASFGFVVGSVAVAETVRCFSQVAPDGPATAAARKPLVDRRKVAGRSRAGRLAAATRALLTEHVGGNPTAVQRELIDRATALRVRLYREDERFERTSATSPAYAELSEAYGLILLQLDGPQQRAQRTTTTPRHAAARHDDAAQELENA